MKKSILYKVMTVALIAVVSMTFTACGGDSDDGLKTAPGDNEQGGVTSSNIEYIVPCLQWGITKDQIKQYMAGNVWTLQTDADSKLLYEKQNGTKIEYTIATGNSWNPRVGLDSSKVIYRNTTVKDWQWLVDKTQKQYDVTMDSFEKDGHYSAEVTFNLNGNEVEIIMVYYPTGELQMKWMLI